MKDVTRARMVAEVFSRRMNNKIGMGVVKANYPSKLKEYGGPWPGGHIKVTVYSRKNVRFKGSSRQLLKSMKFRRSFYST